MRRQLKACKATGGCQDEASWTADFSTAGSALLPHTDGYVYGDHLPDVVFLLAESPADVGGENVMIDAEAIVRRLAANETTAPLLPLARTARVDLTERLESGGLTTGREAFGPVLQRREDGTVWWRRMISQKAWQHGVVHPDDGGPVRIRPEVMGYQSLWAPAGEESERAATQAMLEAVDAAIQLETAAAPRFSVPPGAALVIDNYRILHAREGYKSQGFETDRKVWRLWAWTDRSKGLPEGMAEVGSPLEAETLRAHDEGL
jgi:hypothetical protein